MVTVIQGRDDWYQSARDASEAFTKSYMQRADENTLKRAIGGLPPNATPKQILDTITNVKTYSPESKRNVLSNYLGVKKEEINREFQKEELGLSKNKLDLEEKKLDKANKKAIRFSGMDGGSIKIFYVKV